MSQKARKPSAAKHAAKRAAVLGENKNRNRLPLVAMLACAALVIGGSIFFLGRSSEQISTATPLLASAAEAAEITHPVSLFDDGEAQFFQYQGGNGITVKYFVLKSSDGIIRAAFDACDTCWPAGKGYYQKDDHMVCRNCRRQFASIKVNEVKGGCNPAPLNREIAGAQVVIRAKDILAGKQYFDFKRASGA